MTVAATNVSSGPYTGNGATTVFPFVFSAGSAAEVQVLVNSAVVTVGFTISLNSNQSTNPGGSVTFAGPPVNGAIILITSNPSFQQLISFKDSGPFLQSTLDIALDRVARLCLYLRDKISRAVVFPVGETVSTLPAKSTRLNKYLGFNGSGDFAVLDGTGGDTALRTQLAAPTGYTLIGGIPHVVTPQMFGAVADNVTDDYPAIQAAIDYLATLKMTTQYGYGKGSPRLFMPASEKAYYCSQKLIVSHTLNWEFENGEGAAGGCAVIRFPAGQGGILLKYDGTTGGAAGSVLSRPFLQGGFAGTEGEYHGIEFQTHCTLIGPNVYNFQGDGIFTDTDVVGNVNGSIIQNPLCQGNRNGLYIAGANSNALTITNPEPIKNRRYGHWQKLTLGSAIISGNSTDNGQTATGGGIPFTMCSNGTNRYFVLPNQDAAASTIAPPAGATNNAVWAYFGPGGAYTQGPLWVSGTQTFRAGGAARFEGAYEQNVFVSYYYEPDQAPIVVDSASQSIFLSAISGRPRNFNGTPYGAALQGNGIGLTVTGSLNVGDTANGVLPGGAILNVGGDAYLTRGNSVVYDPILHLNSTNAYATIQFEYQAASEAQFQYYHGGGFYHLLNNAAHLHHFYVGGSEIASISSTALNLDSGIVLKVNGTQVVGARQTGTPSDATDLATALTLVNALKTKLIAHGLIS